MAKYDDFDEIAFLDSWVRSAEQHSKVSAHVNLDTTQSLHRSLSEQLPVLETLARREGGQQLVDEISVAAGSRWRDTIRPALDLKARIDKRDLLARLASTNGPVLPASALHPDVWRAARRPWEAGLHRNAVGDAATAVEAMTKIKAGLSSPSGARLYGEVFSLEPPAPGRPRLRFTELELEPERWRSAHAGALEFGRGCMEGIRNWAAHTLDETDEQVAVEYLAALSVLARWVERATVNRVD